MKFIYTIITSIALLLASTFFFPSEGYAANGDVYQVGGMVLNVRSDASTEAPVVGKLQAGDQVVEFQEKYGWIQTYYDGKEAWVAKHHLRKIGQMKRVQANEENVTVKANSTNIRSGPGTSYPAIGSSSSGDTYRLQKTEGDWHQIVLANGEYGWVASWLTDTKGEPIPASNESAATVQAPEQQASSTSSDLTSLDGYNIMLDPGHGGRDSGAVGINGVQEKMVTLATAHEVAEHIRDAGANVIMTRTNDNYISLEERVEMSDDYFTHAFVSIHYNAFPDPSANGMNTFYYSQTTDQQLAENVHGSLASKVDLQDRGILREGFRVIRTNNAPSILLELGFITNANDLAIIQTDTFKQQVGEAITTGLQNYFQAK